MTVPRTKSLAGCDPDYRRTPKSPLFCVRCQRDLQAGQVYRYVQLVVMPDGDMHLLHPDDDLPGKSLAPVGPECLRHIGAEWTVPPDPRYRR